MKPEKLILCGWGPYREETVIDFTKLNNTGIFLITGQTGAGKTTIFDAIAYALYGVMSGQIREKGSVRSDFALAETKTYVELYMRHKEKTYHITRNPEYLRPKKRKSGESAFTKEKENAVLTMPDGSVIAGNQDVTNKMEELLCMDARQFCQISMIAQGEFSRLLFASSAEKNAIFRELFGTGIYAQVQQQLKMRSGHLYQEYMSYRNKLEEDIRLFDGEDEEWRKLTEDKAQDPDLLTEYLSRTLAEDNREVSAYRKEAEKKEEELLFAQKELESIRQINARFDEAQKNRRILEELKKDKPRMEELKERITMVKKVEVLFLEEKLLMEKEAAWKDAGRHTQRLKDELLCLEEQKKSREALLGKKDGIEHAFLLQDQLTGLEKEEKEQLQKQETLTKDLKEARSLYEEAQKKAQADRKSYEDADVRYKKAVIGIAAKLVKEGEPCPVCGSMEHPHVARTEEEIPDEKQLQTLKERAEQSSRTEQKRYEKALLLTNEGKKLQEILQNIQKLKEELINEQNRTDPEAVAYAGTHTRDQFTEWMKESLELQAMQKEKENSLQEASRSEERKKEEAAEEKKRFEIRLKENGFEEKAEYKKAVSCLKDLDRWEKEYRSYEDSYLTAQKMQDYLQDLLKGCERKEESGVTERIGACREFLRTARSRMEKLQIQISQKEKALQGILKNQKKAEKIRKEYGIVKDLDDLANGNNAKRLVFEQYVLAGYFEAILKSANARLAKMTEGRYELLRAAQISDGRKKDNLEMEVMDYYTGRRRNVKTLSGGETFKTSLALALGMSDCIQAENGGMEVETLFIDEGFGALDEESIEQACETLKTLAGRNRMVGVISHVTQLQEKMEHQIVVEKHNDGSRIRIF